VRTEKKQEGIIKPDYNKAFAGYKVTWRHKIYRQPFSLYNEFARRPA
jgi:hypothetical protein